MLATPMARGALGPGSWALPILPAQPGRRTPTGQLDPFPDPLILALLIAEHLAHHFINNEL